MTMQGKVPLCRLYERTSASGNRYFSGRLGGAKVIVFLDQKAEADVPVWQVYLQDARHQNPGNQRRPLPWTLRRPSTTACRMTSCQCDDGDDDDQG